MANARVISRPRSTARAKAQPESSGKKKWTIAIVLLLVLLSGLGAWAMSSGKDPHVAKVEALRAQMDNATGDQRRELRSQMRAEFEQMPEAAREQFFADRQQEFEARQAKELSEFFAKPYAEQMAIIDKQIDESERRRKEWQQRQQNGGAQANRQGFGGPGGGRGFGGPGGGGRARSNDPAAALQRGKNYLDRTSPESRAQRSEQRRMMQMRRQQRGLQG
jgi:hypothetical protein